MTDRSRIAVQAPGVQSEQGRRDNSPVGSRCGFVSDYLQPVWTVNEETWIKMAVNLSKNGPALMAAYKEVVDSKLGTNWALFTYEGNSNDIRLAEKGDGGLEEMVEELNSGKVMYAFCRVQDPNSGLPKYVLINWTGEGVKDSRKGICANHVGSMANFLKGAHVTINARGEEDVEPETILAKVAKASGANFNFYKPTEYRDAPRGPVGSVYRKVNAVEEIQETKKSDFWVQTQREEEVRRREETRRAELERQRLERERREMEEKRAKQMEQEKIYQKQREEEEREREQLRPTQQEKEKEKKTGVNSAARFRSQEARSLISQRTFNPRDVFKQREQSFEANERASAAAPRPGKLQSPFLSQTSPESQAPPQPLYPPAPAALPTSPTTPAVSRSPAAAVSRTPAGTTDTTFAEEEEEGWSDEFDDDAEEAAPEECAAEDDVYEEQTPAGTEEEDLYENVYQDGHTAEDRAADVNGQNVRARALYDYQAVDDTELTFDPDDIITGIEMVDEGWWRGYGPGGHYGLFPANYVELL
ncbi:drebrin-like protein A isoform X2 [Xiphias gladius]|uniref:drebrin-like protein A isoform X2 n=1 Tax=Xiphias gladius TaxID=8245 RepID=UPI001A9879AE|nr:drebrin-like protein A isoform X2 [Xiphias gladius]